MDYMETATDACLRHGGKGDVCIFVWVPGVSGTRATSGVGENGRRVGPGRVRDEVCLWDPTTGPRILPVAGLWEL